jgi:hypothetical protein
MFRSHCAISAFFSLIAVATLVPDRACFGFSVLAHQSLIDRSWQESIVPALRQRFPGATDQDLEEAHAYAHGGSHIADLGYFPLGSRLFTDLVHYVESGRFVTALLADASTVDEYAFALGAASHYVADTIGHPEATNRIVPEIYPDLREEFGDTVTYADDHSSHLNTEFRFDILELSRSRQSPELFHHAIAFEVAEPLLDRAFRETYGLGLDDLFTNTQVAITTYRWGFRELMQEATGIAWQLYQADIQNLDPLATPQSFIGSMSRGDFEKEFGDAYDEAGYFAKFFALVVKLVPNVGPFERLPYKALPPEAREQYAAAFDRALAEFQSVVARERKHRLILPDRNLDTGKPTRRGEYAPADEAYAKLAEKLDQTDFVYASRELRNEILRFYAEEAACSSTDEDCRPPEGTRRALARLRAERDQLASVRPR